MAILGIDVGGSGIKIATVDVDNGALLSEKIRVVTPQPATPNSIAREIKSLAEHHHWQGPVGIGFPSSVQHGIVRTAANIDKSFIGLAINQYFSSHCQLPVHVINDADAAGLAEMRFGAGKNHPGVVLIITIGTGLGTALFSGGHLLPNTELGHILLNNGHEAEHYASESVRANKGLSWEVWGERFNHYLKTMEKLLWPDLIILGGGASTKLNKFSKSLTTKAPVVAASFLNQAGIVGAAIYAKEMIAAESD